MSMKTEATKKMKKPKTKTTRKERSKSLPTRIKKKHEGPAATRPDEDAQWRLPTAHWLALDKARLDHWWAKMNGGDTVKTLKAWAALLHVPRTRKAKA